MLYEFYGHECPHCQKMRALSDKLIREHKVDLKRREVWHNKENMKLIKKFDVDEACGGVPFFYDDATGKWLCGEVTYKELKAWACPEIKEGK